ncbi:hypothetical protein BP6252_13026 [Coleophoma cylindrospora]|uniref:Xylanolytic transcriptional activator regulatory domain-containing protein n=1 Tax=Coleophoma cylindrospora TaxID=1849047 RepID=A0A3D8QDP4_9HELO|nr:hypothetical protein BP6252_13026 [Coleophoma cylindrospora]
MRVQRSRQAVSTTLPSNADSDNQHSSLLTLAVPASHPSTSNPPDGTRHPRATSPNPLESESVEELKGRIVTLQRMLSDALSNDTASESIPSLSSAKRPVPAPSRHKDGSLVKNRFVSSSQWMSFYNEFNTIIQYGYNPPASEIHSLITKCKEIGRLSKAQRPVRFPHLPDLGDLVPANYLSDILVHHYLRTFESVYRILHIPSFKEEYSQYKQKPQTATNEFVMKLLLVMAIGTTFYKESHISFSDLRTSAISWINAVQEWLAASSEKRLLNINGIQIRCLLLLARQTSAIEGEMLWGSAGHLLRLAMQIGLHRDPKRFPKLSILEAEVRRRLWTTVLEINLQSSLDSGMPALISLKEFDTGLPSNIDDSDILESSKTHPAPKPMSVYTQSSLQIILRKSISLRLEALQVVNDFNREPSYDDVLRISHELDDICRSYKFLEAEISSGDSTSCSTTTFQYNILDLLVRRFYLPLHRLWCLKARSDPRYCFSRKVLIDTCFAMISYQADPDFLQAITLGRGIFREAIQHPALLICYELISQLEEAGASSSTMQHHRIMREPLHQALHSQIELLTNRIRAGDSNVQGHLFTSMALGQIEAMKACRPIEQGIYDAAKKSLKLTNDLLRGRDTFTPRSSVEVEQIVAAASPQPTNEAFSGTWVLEGVAGYNFWLDDNLTGEAQDLWFSSQQTLMNITNSAGIANMTDIEKITSTISNGYERVGSIAKTQPFFTATFATAILGIACGSPSELAVHHQYRHENNLHGFDNLTQDFTANIKCTKHLDAAHLKAPQPSFLPEVPQRRGGWPEVMPRILPQRQYPEYIAPEPHARLQEIVRRIAAERPDLFEMKPLHTEGGTAESLYAIKDLPTLNQIAQDAAANQELTHVHPSDNSLHVFLSDSDAKKVAEAGWGQRFAIPAVKGGWIMVYAPRDEAVLDLVEIVRATAAWITMGVKI